MARAEGKSDLASERGFVELGLAIADAEGLQRRPPVLFSQIRIGRHQETRVHSSTEKTSDGHVADQLSLHRRTQHGIELIDVRVFGMRAFGYRRNFAYREIG